MGASASLRELTDQHGIRDALAQLRIRLLDLTGRNRLLNYKHPIGKSLQFVVGDPVVIHERLSDGKSMIAIKGLPEPARVDLEIKNGRLSRPDPKDWAIKNRIPVSTDLATAGDRGDGSYVRALMYVDDLAKHCRKIERESILAIEETGANMLHLVLGFLEFPDQKDSDRIFSAPLISVPVVLSKRDSGGNQHFFLRFTGDDITENISLKEKLRQDHGLILPDLDEEEIDVEAYFSAIQKVIKPRVNFSFRRRVSLCLLSFTNMLLVRDLNPDNWPTLKDKNGLLDHAIVRQVFSGNGAPQSVLATTAEEHAVEDEPGKSIPLVFDADSSQHSALVDVLAARKNSVIEGPPGTGKSQTIANLIAASLAQGQTVLFVSEKLAALQVVRNRLAMAGLDAFTLELHSTKSNKKQVLEEISRRCELHLTAPRELVQNLEKIEAHRKELKAYADLLNAPSNSLFGLTLHEAMWRAERFRRSLVSADGILTQVSVAGATEMNEAEFSRQMQALDNLAIQFASLGGFDKNHPFWGFFPNALVPGDEQRFESALELCREGSERLIHDADELQALLGMDTELGADASREISGHLKELVSELDLNLPLHLVAGFIEVDRTGDTARRELEGLQRLQQRFTSLEQEVRAGLLDESFATEDSLAIATQLQQTSVSAGFQIGTVGDCQVFLGSVRQSLQLFTSSIEVVKRFCDQRHIPFEVSVPQLEKLQTLGAALVTVPDEHFDIQRRSLIDTHCPAALENLRSMQSKWVSIEERLSRSLYLDDIPEEAKLKRAISVLRTGQTWYRFLQPEWRAAIRLHRSLQKEKLKLTAKERLADLHSLSDLLSTRQAWKSHLAWSRILAQTPPDVPFPLERFISVARWNVTAAQALQEYETDCIALADLKPASARQMKRDFTELIRHIEVSLKAIRALGNLLPALFSNTGTTEIDPFLEKASVVTSVLDEYLNRAENRFDCNATIAMVISAHHAAVERAKLRQQVSGNMRLRELVKEEFAGTDTKIGRLLATLSAAERIRDLPVPACYRSQLLTTDPVGQARALIKCLEAINRNFEMLDEFKRQLQLFGDFQFGTWVRSHTSPALRDFSRTLSMRVTSAIGIKDSVIPWSVYVARRKESEECGQKQFVDLLESGHVRPEHLSCAYGYATFSTIVRDAFHRFPQLGKFSGLKHSRVREEFRRLDRDIIKLRGADIGARTIRAASPPYGSNGTRVDEKTEMALIHHLMPQQRPRIPVRKLLIRAGRAVQALKPCFMMGPQAVAQYLAPDGPKFDVVVMDEASQLRPEEAIGAIARGGQLVVVGDPKQLPPTSFFSKMVQSGEDGEQFTTTDAESILDVCVSHFRPPRHLRWHYRSQHHSLIAFSNHKFYRNLVVFPSPYGHSDKLGIKATYLSDAVYEDQTNYKEAVFVVNAVIDHIATRPNDSLGVVTLNLKQRDVIQELLDERLDVVASAEEYKERWRKEGQPLFVKNLENVQGDERDAIIISTTFGKPRGSEAVRQNFGPISRQGGWRRLNVLFTRAKKSVGLFTSLKPEDIVVDPSTPEGTRALRDYLEFARSGALLTSEETGLQPESDFEIAVIDYLKSRGYEVTPQLGMAGYRIDIAVKHHDQPGAYMAAIECDGASYHSALSVRDRDRIRQEILEAMGWRGRIWRIWSTDWFRSPRTEAERLVSFLDEIRKTWKPEFGSGKSWSEIGRDGSTTSASVAAAESTDVLYDEDEQISVKIGDTVRYVDVKKTEDVLTVQITESTTDTGTGLVHRGTPLAQTLLGAIAGDEVTMHLPGASSRTFRILEVRRA